MSMFVGKSAQDYAHVEDSQFADDPILPKGSYNAFATEIVEDFVEDRGSDRTRIVFQLQGGQYDGVKITDWLETGGTTHEVKEKISNQKLKSLFTLCNVQGVANSTDAFLGTVISINNKPYKGSDGVMRNGINFYERAKAVGSPSAAPMQAAAPTQAAPPVMQQPAPAPRPQQAIPQPAPAPAPMPANPLPQPPAGAPAPQPPPPPPQYAAQQQQFYAQPAGAEIGDIENAPF